MTDESRYKSFKSSMNLVQLSDHRGYLLTISSLKGLQSELVFEDLFICRTILELKRDDLTNTSL